MMVEKCYKDIISVGLQLNAPLANKKLSVFIIDDIFDHVGEEVLPLIMLREMVESLLKFSADKSHNLRQAVNFGLGVVIQKAPNVFNE